MNGAEMRAQGAAADKPALQRELDDVEASVAMLSNRLSEIDVHLDGLTNRPPRAVEERVVRSGDAPAPVPATIEGRLHLLSVRLGQLLNRSEDVMKRLHSAF